LLGTFAFTWALWVPAGLDLRGALDLPVPPTPLVIVGAFGPMVAALTVAGRHGGWDEVKALLARLRFRAATPRWYLLALVLGAVTLVPALVFLASGGSTDAGTFGSHLLVLPIHFLIVATIGGGLDEELGWRGMAQPLLQRRLSPLPANLVLGVIWALWHLPLWLDPTSAQSAYPFAVYTAVIVGHSLVTGYLYNASGGSLLVAVIAHSANNTFDGLRYAILGDSGRHLLWQVILAAAAMGLGVATVVKTGGRLGIRADHSSNQGGHSEA
jgi:membrane protease YdiL (CAAX protease family)